MRGVPSTDTVPTSVVKYLLPHERQVIATRQHPAVLIRPIGEVLLGLAIAGLLSNTSVANSGNAVLVIWLAWLVVVLRLATKVFEWYVNYFVVTSQRMLLATGIITRKVNMLAGGKGDRHELPPLHGRTPAWLRRVHPGVGRQGPGPARGRPPALPGAALPGRLRADLQGQGRRRLRRPLAAGRPGNADLSADLSMAGWFTLSPRRCRRPRAAGRSAVPSACARRAPAWPAAPSCRGTAT